MAYENNENANSNNSDEEIKGTELENDQEPIDETDDIQTLIDKNKQLFARAKKAEGFEKDANGKWVKKTKAMIAETKPDIERTVKQTAASPSDIATLVSKELEKRDLESMDMNDMVKSEIQKYASLTGISVKKALESDYIKFLLDKEEKNARIENASLGGKSKSSTSRDYDEMKPSDFDLSTKEGREDWDKYKQHLNKKR